MRKKIQPHLIVAILILIVQACNMPASETEAAPLPSATAEQLFSTEQPPALQHQTIPISAPDSRPYPDVNSFDTAPEGRAPYGDSYDLNRLERPFLQDMTYVPDLDITSLSISEDADWYYISIGLVGKDPNNSLNIHYGVEIDNGLDGFGDFLILAQPPYSEEWTAENVQIYQDTNRDTAGTSSTKSDAPFSGNGYEQLIHSINQGIGDDIDLVWVRVNASENSTVQFAIKKAWAGNRFMFAVLADAGLKDVTKLDYIDYFTHQEAGSPIRSNSYYPLQALYAIDNTCMQAFGFTPTGFEPKICPEIIQPSIVEQPVGPGTSVPTGCQPPPGGCGGLTWYPEPYCVCFE